MFLKSVSIMNLHCTLRKKGSSLNSKEPFMPKRFDIRRKNPFLCSLLMLLWFTKLGNVAANKKKSDYLVYRFIEECVVNI